MVYSFQKNEEWYNNMVHIVTEHVNYCSDIDRYPDGIHINDILDKCTCHIKGGKLHREDGPAICYDSIPHIIYYYGQQYHWYLDGHRYEPKDWVIAIVKLTGQTEEEVMTKYVMPYMLS